MKRQTAGADAADAGSEALRILRTRLRDGSFAEMVQDWKWILRYSRQFSRQLVLYTLLSVFSTLFSLASSVAGKYIIDIITSFNRSNLWLIAVVFLGTAALSIGSSALFSRISAKLGVEIENAIQRKIFGDILNTDWLELSRLRNGDVLSRLTADIPHIASGAVSWLPNLITYSVSFVSTLFVLLYYDPIMALIALLSAPLLVFVSAPLLRRLRSFNEKVRRTRSDMTSFETETLYHMDTVKSFGIESETLAHLAGHLDEYRTICLEYNRWRVRIRALLSVLSRVVEMAAFAYCLWQLWRGSITFGTMSLFLQQRANLSSVFSGLIALAPSAITCSVCAHRVREISELPKEQPHSRRLLPNDGDKYGVRIRNASYGYELGRPVLEDAALDCAPGETVAVIGPSGEGKTTLLRMLLGLIRPDRGSVDLVDSDGKSIAVSSETRAFFSYVPQGNSVFSGTVAENLRIVAPQADETEMRRALDAACAWEFVSTLPEGLLSGLGEHGHGLSEGQAQRIAIARALLRNAPILLLDEATSAIDEETQAEILDRIRTRYPNRSCIMITHRLNILEQCARVYRIKEAQLTELSAIKKIIS